MRASPLLLLPLVLLSVGCSQKVQEIGGVRRQRVYQSVVSLSPSTTEIMYSVGDSRRLRGRTEADNYPTSVTTVPVVASVKPDYEAIKRASPDLIIYDPDLYGPGDIEKIKAVGADTMEFKAHDLAGFKKEIYEFGSMIGGETNADSYVDRIDREAMTASEGLAKPLKVAVVIAGSGGNDMVAGVNSFQAAIVKVAGGTPVGPESDKFEKISPESFIASAPDVIVLATSEASKIVDVEALTGDSRLKTVPAISGGHIVGLNSDVVLRRGSRVDTFIKDLHHALALEANK